MNDEELRRLRTVAAGSRLEGAVRKAEKSSEHIEAFVRGTQTFIDVLSASVIRCDNGEEWVYEVRLEESPQLIDLALILGDAVHNLRSALDHAACALVLQNGDEPSRGTTFPIWRKRTPPPADRWRSLCRGALDGASAAAIDTVAAIEAFPGGDQERLRDVHLLDIRDKHHAIVVAGMAILGQQIDVGGFEEGATEMTVTYTTAETHYPIGNGSVLLRTPKVGGVTADFEFDLAMELPETRRVVVARPFLSQMSIAVADVLDRVAPLVRTGERE